MRFETEIIERSNTAVIRCNGRFVYGDGMLGMREVALQLVTRFQHSILCFRHVDQIDAWGMGVLAELQRMAGDNAGSVIVVGVTPPVREALQVAGLLEVLQVRDSEQDALAALRRVA